LKILIIRLSAIGDVIHCLPAAAELKRRLPGALIGWVVEPAASSLVLNNPAIDLPYVLPRKQWLRGLSLPWRWPGVITEIGAFWSKIRQERFDVAADFQGLLKSAVCTAASGAPVRAGFAGTREGAEWFLTDRLEVGDYFGHDRHVVDLNLSLAEFVCLKAGITAGGSQGQAGEAAGEQPVEFPLPEPQPGSYEKINEMLGLSGGEGAAPLAVLIPGTTWTSKIWPAEYWSDLGVRLWRELGFRLCLAGGAAEEAMNAQIAAAIQGQSPEVDLVDLTGKTSLLDLVPLFRQSRLVVGPDTGPVHLAAAVGKPKVVGVYGSTPWARLGPYGPQCRTVSLGLWCQPCYQMVCPLSTRACLKELSVEKVISEIVEFLK
jgi:heptosyltransferase-1